MTTSEERFDVFGQEYAAWHNQTQALPIRRDRRSAKGTFELDLDHLIDYVQPIMAAAAEGSNQFDYPKVAGEYIHDLDQLQVELERATLVDSERHAYFDYLCLCRCMLDNLSSLPVPPEGHLGFRGNALRYFRFLIDEYTFEEAGSSPIAVRFVTDAMFVDVSHSPEFPMNSILIGRRTSEETPTCGFILDDFAYVAGLGVVFDYDQFDLQDSAGIAKFLETAASLVRIHGSSVLSGDAKGFREFQKKADERERSYIEKMERQQSAQH